MNCNHCGTALSEGATVCTVCGTPVQTASVNPVELPAKENVAMGTLGALAGALLGGASIILLSRLGYIAALSGLLIAFATLKGYELLGKGLSKTGMVICFALMLVTPFAAYNLDLVWQCYAEWQEYGVTMGETISLVLELMQEDGELLRSYLSELGMLYLFMVLGAFGIIRNALRNV